MAFALLTDASSAAYKRLDAKLSAGGDPWVVLRKLNDVLLFDPHDREVLLEGLAVLSANG